MPRLGLPWAWIDLDGIGPYDAPFVRTDYDFARLQRWSAAICGSRDVARFVGPFTLTYRFVLDERGWEVDSRVAGAVTEASAEIIELYRIVHGIRPRRERDSSVDLLSRVLLFAGASGVDFQRERVGVLCLVFHVVFYGLLERRIGPFSVAGAEAVAAGLYVRALTRPQSPFRIVCEAAQDIAAGVAGRLELDDERRTDVERMVRGGFGWELSLSASMVAWEEIMASRDPVDVAGRVCEAMLQLCEGGSLDNGPFVAAEALAARLGARRR